MIGFPTDLRWVETLVTSLLVQLTAAMLANCPSGVTASASAGWRRSFIIGFASEVSDRLEADRRDAVQATAGPNASNGHRDGTAGSAAVVLASRADEVRDDFRRRFPNVRSSWASAGRSRAGEQAGRAAGREASLTRERIGGRRGPRLRLSETVSASTPRQCASDDRVCPVSHDGHRGPVPGLGRMRRSHRSRTVDAGSAGSPKSSRASTASSLDSWWSDDVPATPRSRS